MPKAFEIVALFLYSKLPLNYFQKHGHEGIIRISHKLMAYLSIVFKLIKMIFNLVRVLRKIYRDAKNIVKALLKKDSKSPHLIDYVHVNSSALYLSHSILYKGYLIDDKRWLVTYFERLKAAPSNLVFFTHLYPENQSVLPEERKNFGFISLDNWPVIPIHEWPTGKTYKNVLNIDGIASGYYRIKIGIYSAINFERLSISQTDDDAIDLGWIYIEQK